MSDTPSPSDPATGAATTLRGAALGTIALGLALLVCGYFFFAGARTEAAPDKDKKEKDSIEMFSKEKEKSKDKAGDTVGLANIAIGDRFYAGVWALALGLGFIGLGSRAYATAPPPGAGEERAAQVALKTHLMLAGCLVGLLTFLLGLFLAYAWGSGLTEWLERGQKREAKWPLYALAVVFGGLVAMFLTLQAAKSEIRQSAPLRRLYYGAGAAMTAMLLLVLLAGFDIYASVKWTSLLNTSESGYHTLDERSKDLLHGLNEPVKATFVVDSGIEFYNEFTALLQSCAAESPRFEFELLNPAYDGKKIAELFAKAKIKPEEGDDYGILLTAGDDGNQSTFIRLGELIERKQDRNTGEMSLTFAGEGRLMAELAFLGEGKVKPILYFLQGSGELDIGDSERAPRGAASPPERSASNLIRYLKDRKYDIRPLKLELNGGTVDFDTAAAAVVALAPNHAYGEAQVKFLADYMKPADPKRKPGRLLAVLPPFKEQGELVVGRTGLEPLLNEFGIDLLPAKIVSFSERQPTEILDGIPAPQLRGTSLERLGNNLPWPSRFPTSRPMRIAPGLPESFQVKPFLITVPGPITWYEKDFKADHDSVLKALLTGGPDGRVNRALAEAKMATQNSVPFAMIASLPPAGGAPDAPPEAPKPRVAVFGSDAFNDRFFQQTRGLAVSDEIFGEVADWLRDKPLNIGIAPTEKKALALPSDTSDSQLVGVPMAVFALIAIGLGASVWVVRRK